MRKAFVLFCAAFLFAVLSGACGGGGAKQENGAGIALSRAVATLENDAPPPGSEKHPVTFKALSAPVSRLVIPSIGVDRATIEGRVDSRTNEMIAPAGPFDIAYYTYSGPIGKGNSVFSGHVDYINVGPAVFWDLRKLKPGDDIVIRLSDGSEARYTVKFNRIYPSGTGPWQELFARDADNDVITLYTCAGDFSRAEQNYSERRVVRAERSG